MNQGCDAMTMSNSRGFGCPAVTGPRALLWCFLASIFAHSSLAQVQFSEVAVQAGIGGEFYGTDSDHGLGVNWLDYNNDGWPDLFLVNGLAGDGAHLFRNEGDGSFSNQDALLPALPVVEMMGSVFADYDNDGDVDLHLFTEDYAGVGGPVNILLQNQWVENGGTTIEGEALFVDVTEAAGVLDLLDAPLEDGPAYRSATGGWLDYDRDGHVDLYVCHWDRAATNLLPAADRLYRNKGDGTFEDVTDAVGLVPGPDYDRACLTFVGGHLDSDLWPDLYIGNIGSGLGSRDFIFQNNAGVDFSDRTADSVGLGDDADSAMGVTLGDIELDGDWDIYLSDLGGGTLPQGNPLYTGTGTGIVFNDNTADVAGVTGDASWGVNFLDVDHDGYEDLFVATMPITLQHILYLNDGDGTFSEFPGGLGNGMAGRGSAYADYDRDGDLDLVVSNERGRLELFRNDTVSTGHWLQLQLISNQAETGNWSNRNAIGTLVKVSAGGKSYMRQVIAGDSGHGQNSFDLHLGLGDAETIDQLEVYWPSGEVVTLNGLSTDTFMAVSELGTSVAMVSPALSSATLAATTLFEWEESGTPADSFRLLAGTSLGGSDIHDGAELPAGTTSESVSGLPTDGSPVFVRLLFQLNGYSHHIDYRYADDDLGPVSGNPNIPSPADGSVLEGATQIFNWSANGLEVDRWRLDIGTRRGGRDILRTTLDPDVLSYEASNLPTDGSQIYVRLAWSVDGEIFHQDYIYTASGEPGDPPPPGQDPEMTAPTPGSVLPGSAVLFEWDAMGTNVTQWRVEIGNSAGGRDILREVLGASATSFQATGLPTDGRTLYVRLTWRTGGTWFPRIMCTRPRAPVAAIRPRRRVSPNCCRRCRAIPCTAPARPSPGRQTARR